MSLGKEEKMNNIIYLWTNNILIISLLYQIKFFKGEKECFDEFIILITR